MDRFVNLVKREAKIIAASLIVGFIITVGITTKAYSDKISHEISERFIRFHVVANSDVAADQLLKEKVRDGVLEALSSDINACESIEESRELLKASIGRIEDEAERIIQSEGYSYGAKASLVHTMFPTREYGDIILAAGMYEALRIELGDGVGKNWWCVVYPPLCYVDVTNVASAKETKNRLKNELSDSEYKFVVKNEDVSVKVKFKVVEFWQESKMVATEAFRR